MVHSANKLAILGGLIFSLFWGWLCRELAKKKNRDKTLAFILGMIFTFIAGIFYWALEPKIQSYR